MNGPDLAGPTGGKGGAGGLLTLGLGPARWGGGWLGLGEALAGPWPTNKGEAAQARSAISQRARRALERLEAEAPSSSARQEAEQRQRGTCSGSSGTWQQGSGSTQGTWRGDGDPADPVEDVARGGRGAEAMNGSILVQRERCERRE